MENELISESCMSDTAELAKQHEKSCCVFINKPYELINIDEPRGAFLNKQPLKKRLLSIHSSTVFSDLHAAPYETKLSSCPLCEL